MRILVLNHEFPPIGGGGGRAAEHICQTLAKRGYEIEVLTSHLEGLTREEDRDGYHITRVPCKRTQPFKASFLSMGLYVLAGLWAARRYIRVSRPDLIHVHFAVPAGPLAWMLSKIYGIPYVLTAHLGDVPGGTPEKTGGWFRFVFPFTRPIWRGASAIVAVSEFTRGLALKHYNEEIQVIPNGVDLDAPNPDNICVSQTPRIVFAGRFMVQKAPVQIVRVLKELKELPWECVMIGDGPLMEDVKAEIHASGLEDRFKLPGWVEPAQVLELFEKSDILFMPSLSEGLPVVGVQALSKGLAIVASQIGGFLDLVEQGKNGYMEEVGNTDRFVVRLRELLLDREKLLDFRRASLEKAREFDINRVVDAYEKVFTKVLSVGK
ncbi:MAG: glycosyltransferase family 4 protein [Anaerolineales bacterium]